MHSLCYASGHEWNAQRGKELSLSSDVYMVKNSYKSAYSIGPTTYSNVSTSNIRIRTLFNLIFPDIAFFTNFRNILP